MARQLKSGLDYFSLDVNMDDKVKLIEAKYGLTGFGVVIKLWQKIYNDGYFIEWTEERELLFSKDINVDINSINEIINDCLRWKIFDQAMFDKYSILTSKGIQKRFVLASERRKEIELVEEYWLISRDIKANKNGEPRVIWVNAYINPVNVDINHENVDIGTQSKVKESKGKESKGKESKGQPPIIPLGDVAVVVESESENPTIGLRAIQFAHKAWGRPLSPLDTESIQSWCIDFSNRGSPEPDAVVIEALKISSSQNVRNMRYVTAILRDWLESGVTEIAHIENREEERRTNKKPPGLDQPKAITQDDCWASVFIGPDG